MKTHCHRTPSRLASALALAALCICPLASRASATDGGAHYALLVGVGKYADAPDGSNDLGGCVPDAKNVLGAITTFAHGCWAATNCYSLYDYDATLANARSRLQALASAAKSGDTVLYYQSSHGWADTDTLEAAICMTDDWYWDYDFAEDLQRFKTGVRVIVVIDACQSAGMFMERGKGAASRPAAWNFAANVEARRAAIQEDARKRNGASNSPSVGWVTACNYDQTSVDVGTGGYFTIPFVNALKSAATDADGDGCNDFMEMFAAAAAEATDPPDGDDPGREPQACNESVLRSVAAWEVHPAGYVWKGGTGGNKVSVAANWEGGVVPPDDSVVYFTNAAPASVDCDVTFRPGEICFAEGCGKVAFGGSGGVADVRRMVNESSQSHAFNVPVSFLSAIAIQQQHAPFEFAAGATGDTFDFDASPAELREARGTFTVGSVTGDGGCQGLVVEAGSSVTASSASVRSGSFVGRNNGTIAVTGTMTAGATDGDDDIRWTNPDVSGGESCTGTFYVNRLVLLGSGGGAKTLMNAYDGDDAQSLNTYVIGPGGVVATNRALSTVLGWDVWLRSGGDYAISPADGAAFATTAWGAGTLVFDTSDWQDSAVGRTVTVDGSFAGDGDGKLSVEVRGCGTLRLRNAASSGETGPASVACTYTGDTTVMSNATLSVAGGSAFAGRVRVRSGGTLELPDSATAGIEVAGNFAFGSGGDNRGSRLALGGLAAGVTPITANTYNIYSTSYSGTDETLVSFAETPAPGTYTVITATSGGLVADHAARLVVEDPLLRGVCSFAISEDKKSVVLTVARNCISVSNRATSLALTGIDELVGAGGVVVGSLAVPASGRLALDPIKTPVCVTGAPTFGPGAKIALADAYAGMTLGRIVLMTWTGTATLPSDLDSLFDASTVAGAATVTTAPAPGGSGTQLVLTVGNYDAEAKEIVVMPVGDSITQGVKHTDRQDYPQYRTSIAARLAANGYKPKFRGIWRKSDKDASGVQVPDDWAYHSGFGFAAVRTTTKSGGLADNMPLYLDIGGYMDVITLLIGTNDMGANGKDAQTTFDTYLRLVNDTAAQRPDARIVGATVLQRNDGGESRVVQFNELLRAEYAKPGKGDLPDNYFLVDLYPVAPYSAETYKDNVHPDWAADATIAEAFYAKIAEVCPLATFAGLGDATATDAPQRALGAAGVAATAEGAGLAAYTNGMTHVFTIEKDGAAGATNSFTSSPYTSAGTSIGLSTPVRKVGYFMELVRKGTSRRRWVWADMDATGKTLDQVDFPWDDAKMQYIATNLHVKSNYAGIRDVDPSDDSVLGVVEGTKWDYGKASGLAGVPDDVFGASNYGWNDTMGTSGGHACFQVHRLFSQTGTDTHWNDAEVLFAWNAWGSTKASAVDEIGIGTYACHLEEQSNGIKTTDYTLTAVADGRFADAATSDAYSVRRLEIWVEPASAPRHGYWLGGDGDFDDPAKWEDGVVPAPGEDVSFENATSAASVSVTGASRGLAFGSAAVGAGVVTFTGEIAFTNIADTSKVAVGANSTVTLVGDLVFANAEVKSVVHTVADGGAFVVTGTLGLGPDATESLNPQVVTAGGCIVAGEIVNDSAGKTIFNVVQTGTTYTQNWVVGPGGITTDSGRGWWSLSDARNSAYFRPNTNDFTVTAPTCIRANFGHYELNTTGWGDGLAHTITLDAGYSDNGKLYIAGTGAVVVNHTPAAYDGQGAYSGSVFVTDTATLAVNAGKQLSTGGTTTVSAGAALALPQSADGAVTFGGTLELQAGARLKFSGLSAGVTPLVVNKVNIRQSGANVTSVTLSEGGVAPAPGTYALLEATGQTLITAHAERLALDDPALDGCEVTFSLDGESGSAHRILVTVARTSFWPQDWNGGAPADAAMQAAFDAWRAADGNDWTAQNAEGAFLLGESVADYAPLDVVSVSLSGDRFEIVTNTDLTKANGRVFVLAGDSPATIETSGTKIAGKIGSAASLIDIDASAPSRFFKVGVDYQTGD